MVEIYNVNMEDIMQEMYMIHKDKLSRIINNSLDHEDILFFKMRDPNGSIFVELSNMIKNKSW